MNHEPWINAAPVKHVAALRQQPHLLALFIVSQAHRAAAAFVGLDQLRVGVEREGGDGGCVEAVTLDDDVDVVGGAAEGGRFSLWFLALVGEVCDDDEDDEDSDRQPHAVPKAAEGGVANWVVAVVR